MPYSNKMRSIEHQPFMNTIYPRTSNKKTRDFVKMVLIVENWSYRAEYTINQCFFFQLYNWSKFILSKYVKILEGGVPGQSSTYLDKIRRPRAKFNVLDKVRRTWAKTGNVHIALQKSSLNPWKSKENHRKACVNLKIFACGALKKLINTIISTTNSPPKGQRFLFSSTLSRYVKMFLKKHTDLGISQMMSFGVWSAPQARKNRHFGVFPP